MEQHPDYKVVDGTFYALNTPAEVIRVLEQARLARTRLAITYGGSDVFCGRVGRSMGPVKVPLLLHNVRSRGGEPLSTTGIAEIRESRGGRVLYRAQKLP